MDDRTRNDRAAALKDRVRAAIDAREAELVATALDLHAHPETAFAEVRSAAALAARARGAGLSVDLPAYGLETAFAAEFGAAHGPCVGILAEYDALPGLGHACGHNVIGTAALGAALGLADLGAALPGRVRLVGTPAEEGGGGKILMAPHGAFDGLDCAMMIHPADRNLPGYRLIAAATLTAVYTGRPAHAAATPEAGINALDALVTAYTAIAALRQQIPGGHRIHATIREGGTATNIIPERAVGVFGVRAPDRAALEALRDRVEACLHAGAMASGAEVAITRDPVEYHDLRANSPLEACFRANAEALGLAFEEVAELPASHAASTDFGNVSHLVPGIHPMIATVPRGTAFHTPGFAEACAGPEAMRAMMDAAKAMAMTAIDVMWDPGLRSDMARAFDLKGHR
jgi:amidohydrolase